MKEFNFETLDKCPSCQSSDIIFSFSKEDPFLKKTFSISHCKNCELYFVNPRIDETHLSELYSDDYYKGLNWDSDTDYHSNYENNDRLLHLKKMYLTHYELIKDATKKSRPRILDAGAGLGFFAQTVLEYDPEASFLSIDLSEHAVTHMIGRGLIAKKCSIAEIKNQTFDAVYMREVIEHVYDLPQTIKNTFSVLNNGGIFFYTTGNTDRVKNLYEWNYVRPVGHINYFNHKSMNHLLRSNGFSSKRRELLNPKANIDYLKNIMKYFLSLLGLYPKDLPVGIKN